MSRPRTCELSERETQVARMAAEGATDREIAARMGVSSTTVRTYWNRMFAKLGASSRTHAVCKMIWPEGVRHGDSLAAE